MWILKTRNAPAVLAPLLCSTSKLSSNTQGLTTDTDTDTDTVISLGLIAYNSFKQFQFIYIFVCFCYHNILNQVILYILLYYFLSSIFNSLSLSTLLFKQEVLDRLNFHSHKLSILLYQYDRLRLTLKYGCKTPRQIWFLVATLFYFCFSLLYILLNCVKPLNAQKKWSFSCAIFTTLLPPGCVDTHNNHSTLLMTNVSVDL